MSAHTITLHVDDGLMWFTANCPFDLADKTRPCWAREIDCETLDPLGDAYCNYAEWVAEVGPEVIANRSITFAAEVEWIAESPQFTLGEVLS